MRSWPRTAGAAPGGGSHPAQPSGSALDRPPLKVILIAALLPLMALGAAFFAMLHAERTAAVEELLARTAAASATAVRQRIGEEIAALQGLASSVAIDRADWAAFHREASRMREQRPDWSNVILTDETNQLFNLLLFGGSYPPLRDAENVREVWRTGEPAIGDLTTDTNGPRTAVRVPVLREGALRYTVVASATPSLYSGELAQQPLRPGWIALATDGANRILGRSEDPDGFIGRPLDPVLSQALADGEVQGLFRLADGSEQYAAFAPVGPAGWHTVVLAPAALVATPAHIGRYAAWAGFAAASVLAVMLLAALFSASMSRRNMRVLADANLRLRGSQAALRAGEERLRMVAETADLERQRLAITLAGISQGVAAFDAYGRLTHLNPAVARLFGVSEDQARSMTIEEARQRWEGQTADGAPVPFDQWPLARALRGETVRDLEVDVRRRDTGERLFFGSFSAAPVTDPDGRVAGAVLTIYDLTGRKAAEERLRLLAREVDHRAMNMLAVIQAMVRLTRAENVRDFAKALEGRIGALARAHTLLAHRRWQSADLNRLVDLEMAPWRDANGQRVHAEGPPVPLGPGAAQSMAMILHELATNAVKHGALARREGRVEIAWSLTDGQFHLRWTERGGPPVAAPPVRKGYGSGLIERAVRQQLGGTLHCDWRPEGLVCSLAIPADRLRRPAPAV